MSDVDHSESLRILIEFDNIAKEYLDERLRRDNDMNRSIKEFLAKAKPLLSAKWSIPAVIETAKKSDGVHAIKVVSKLELPKAKCYWNAFKAMKIQENQVELKKGVKEIFVQGLPLLESSLEGETDKKFDLINKREDVFEIRVSRIKRSSSVVQWILLNDITILPR